MNFGESFKNQRIISGYSQNALAKATGLTQQCISWCEANKGMPSIEICLTLADFYKISLDELVGRSDTFDNVSVAPTLPKEDQELLILFHSLSPAVAKNMKELMQRYAPSSELQQTKNS